MKKTSTATVWLIILNAVGFFMGAIAGLNTTGLLRTDIPRVLLFFAVLPAPLVIVWSCFRDAYGFTKLNFFL